MKSLGWTLILYNWCSSRINSGTDRHRGTIIWVHEKTDVQGPGNRSLEKLNLSPTPYLRLPTAKSVKVQNFSLSELHRMWYFGSPNKWKQGDSRKLMENRIWRFRCQKKKRDSHMNFCIIYMLFSSPKTFWSTYLWSEAPPNIVFFFFSLSSNILRKKLSLTTPGVSQWRSLPLTPPQAHPE